MANFRVNGVEYRLDVEPEMPLLWVLRDELGLTGTKFGCGIAACGACTVHVNGSSTRSCVTPVQAVEGADITTIEGLRDENGEWNEMQKAFFENFALQCGYCTPGFLTSAIELLRENPDPSEAEIREYLSGNICRCSGYQAIIDAVQAAAAATRAQRQA